MLEIALYNPRQHRQFHHASGSLLLARSDVNGSLWTPVDEHAARRTDALVEIVPHVGGVALAMAGCEGECCCGRACNRTGSCHLRVPAAFSIGDTRFEILSSDQPLRTATRPLEQLLADRSSLPCSEGTDGGPSPATVSRWFAAIGSLNRWATSLPELYARAARCAVESIGLDGAMVLRRRDERWEIAASHLPHPELGIHCDRAALDELLTHPGTLFHGSQHATAEAADASSPAIVVAPLRNAAGVLVGAVYGYRSVRQGNARRGIRYLEAHTIELLAGAVSDGIARQEREAEVDRRRFLLERAFVATLENNPKKMIGEKRHVTLLFADLRGSSDLCASLEMDQLYELMGHVMDCFTAAVMDHDGLVIDYYGDGVAAMWNAPVDQSDHAELACRAALRILQTLPEVAADWAELLQRDLPLGIGVHTGVVQVGNSGSTRRMKYGPRGRNVHVASRIEAAAKELQVPLVATRSTVERLSNQLAARRICRARLRGVESPVDLFAVLPTPLKPADGAAWQAYNEALVAFEAGRVDEASKLLGNIEPTDGLLPAAYLATEVQRLVGQRQRRRSTDGRDRHDGIVSLGGK